MTIQSGRQLEEMKIEQEEDFLQTHIYYPKHEEDWIQFKKEISYSTGVCAHHITIGMAAKYILDNQSYHNSLIEAIKAIYSSFDMAIYGKIEICPSIGDNASKYFLRGGNKRSIAFAMKLITKQLIYVPVEASYLLYFSRKDNDNLSGDETSHTGVLIED